jgi:hypothetical protein
MTWSSKVNTVRIVRYLGYARVLGYAVGPYADKAISMTEGSKLSCADIKRGKHKIENREKIKKIHDKALKNKQKRLVCRLSGRLWCGFRITHRLRAFASLDK